MKLVTGGAGYLGSHLAKELIKRGEKVRIFDIQETKYIPKDAEFLKGDMRDIKDVNKAMEDVDTVFHLAFVQSLSKLKENVRYDININGTENFLKVALKNNVKRFVHTSTIEVYGTNPPYPCYEDAPTDSPVGWYGRHKLICENLCQKYFKKGLKVTMLRMPTICGPGWYNHRGLLQLMDIILDGKPVAVIGDGKTEGDFVYYKDVLDGYLLAGEKEKAIGEAFNISARETSTHYELIKG
jgi:UDP-glucose 4-epimerase